MRDYIVTAGGPAAGKSTLLEETLKRKDHADIRPLKRAYVDPDRSCLLKMKHTYLDDLSKGRRNAQDAYEHWREASNFLSNYFLTIALKEGMRLPMARPWPHLMRKML